MLLYVPGKEHDLLLLQWWAQLIADNELHDLFVSLGDAPTNFLKLFQLPTVLFMDCDERGIRATVWFEPMFSGVAASLWARPDYRHRQWVDFANAALREAFNHCKIITTVTKSDHVVLAAKSLHFTFLGVVPYLYGGMPTHVGYLTKEEFIRHNG